MQSGLAYRKSADSLSAFLDMHPFSCFPQNTGENEKCRQAENLFFTEGMQKCLLETGNLYGYSYSVLETMVNLARKNQFGSLIPFAQFWIGSGKKMICKGVTCF